MLRMLMFLAAVSYATAGIAAAEPYWVAYEGNDFPENEGWERVFCDADGTVGQGGAVRTIEDGALVLDSRESVMIVDFYNWSQPIDPDPGETFIMRWRLRVDDIPSSYPRDPVAGVFSGASTAVSFQISEDRIRSTFESGNEATFVPNVFHTFEFTSVDMVSYELLIDGVVRLSGAFEAVHETSRVGWGDGIQGGRSLTTWDYFEFGVVPEPHSLPLILALAFTAGHGFRVSRHKKENRT